MVSKAEFLSRLGEVQISLKHLDKFADIADSAALIKAADLNDDGVVAGARELDAMATSFAAKSGDQAERVLARLETRSVYNPWAVVPPPPKTALSKELIASMDSKYAEHRRRIAETNIGSYFGSKGRVDPNDPDNRSKSAKDSYPKLSAEKKKAFIAEKAKPGTTPLMPVRSDCISWVIENVGAGYKKAAADALAAGDRPTHDRLLSHWNEAYSILAKQPAGLEWLRPLLADGWKLVYWNPDLAHPNEKTVAGAERHLKPARLVEAKGIYFGIKVSGQILDYRPTTDAEVLKGAEPTTKNMAGIEWLKQVPFFIGTARGGDHWFIGEYGVVNEFHWRYEPGDDVKPYTHVKPLPGIAETPLENFGWTSGAVIVPPNDFPIAMPTKAP